MNNFRDKNLKKTRIKKVWIISEYYSPDENTTSYIMTKIAEGLVKKMEVNVITSTPSNIKTKRVERINEVLIYRVKCSNLDKNNLFKRTIKLFLLGVRLFLKSAILVKRNDTILAVTNPATIIFLMRILRIFKKFKLYFLVHDIFPENLVAAKILKPNNIFYKITLYLFNWAYIKADKLVVIGRDMDLYVKMKLGKKCPTIVFIPNFVDVNEIIPVPKKYNNILQEHGLSNKFVILFVGNIGRAQDFNNILRTMELLKVNSSIHLLLIGDGANDKYVKQYITEKYLNNITILPRMKRQYSNDFLNAGDIGLVSLQKGRKGIVSPSKTYSFLAAAKPILAVVDKGSEIYLMINESNCGWWSEPGNPKKLSSLILRISEMDKQVYKMGKLARNLAIDKYSIGKVIPQFQKMFI